MIFIYSFLGCVAAIALAFGVLAWAYSGEPKNVEIDHS
jgi:hypothetical protein